MTLPLTLTPNPNQVAYLLQHGADAELRDEDGHAPEDLVRGANPNAPEDLVRGANPNAPEDGAALLTLPQNPSPTPTPSPTPNPNPSPNPDPDPDPNPTQDLVVPEDGIDAAAAPGGNPNAPGGELARAALLGALCDPTLLLLSKATSANRLYRAGAYAAATAAYEEALQI